MTSCTAFSQITTDAGGLLMARLLEPLQATPVTQSAGSPEETAFAVNNIVFSAVNHIGGVEKISTIRVIQRQPIALNE